MMNLTHWRLLVAVADAQNITHAAEKTGISQSGASQAIAQMESALGVKIFTRDRKQLSLTAVGESIIQQARQMTAHLDAIRVLANEARGVQRGRLRIGCFPSIASAVLPPLLRDFQRRYPDCEVVAVEGSDREVEAWLAVDTVDVGVVLNPAPERNALMLGRDAWVAVVPLGHPLGRRATALGVSLAELAALPFILATGGCHINAQSLTADAGLTLADIRVTVQDWGSACVLVKENLGVALVPESTLPKERHGLRVLPLTPPVHRHFGLVCSASGRGSASVNAFLQEMAGVPEFIVG